MSALSPAPAPALGVRWNDLPTPLGFTDPSCCLSYKQSAYLSPLCFHGLTNPFSRHSFPFTCFCRGLRPTLARRGGGGWWCREPTKARLTLNARLGSRSNA